MTSGLWELVLKGVWTTVQLLVFSGLLATAVAFVVGIARTHRLWIVRFLAGFYTEVFRGTSALVMIFWVFFVLPVAFGWQLVPLWAGTLALGLTYGAYGTEIVRGALNAVDPAQQEGGVALSFTPWQRMRLILLPQAIPEMIPPFSNLLIELLKGTALVSVMGMGDLTFSANLVRLALQQGAEIYTYILLIYFVIAFALTRLMRGLEKKLKAGIGKGAREHRVPARPDRGRRRWCLVKWDWNAVSDFMPYFWDGLKVTLQILVLGSLISFVLGLVWALLTRTPTLPTLEQTRAGGTPWCAGRSGSSPSSSGTPRCWSNSSSSSTCCPSGG